MNCLLFVVCVAACGASLFVVCCSLFVAWLLFGVFCLSFAGCWCLITTLFFVVRCLRLLFGVCCLIFVGVCCSLFVCPLFVHYCLLVDARCLLTVVCDVLMGVRCL